MFDGILSSDQEKSRSLQLKTWTPTIFVVRFVIPLNALANTRNKMLTSHHPLPNYIYLDRQC